MAACSPWVLAACALLAAATPAHAQRTLPARASGYGYAQSQSPAADCAYQFVDIGASGAPLLLLAAGAAPAQDDGAAVVALEQSFEFHGEARDTIVLSSNGYLAFADALAAEAGGDFSNDCPMPALPDNAPSVAARIAALHDELDGGAGGTVHARYFPQCPRPGAADGLPEACTVLQWSAWPRLGSVVPNDFQVLLYHATQAIVLQYAQVDPLVMASASIGLQSDDGADAALWSCNGERSLAPASAVCFYDPRFPPGERPDGLYADGFETP